MTPGDGALGSVDEALGRHGRSHYLAAGLKTVKSVKSNQSTIKNMNLSETQINSLATENIDRADRKETEDPSASTPPSFSLEEALDCAADEIAPENFLLIARDEMVRVFGHDPKLEEGMDIPESGEKDFESRVRRNLILMEHYLKDQIKSQADPERIRSDLITIDRFLNTYLLSQELDAEDAYDEVHEYFEGYLMNQDPVPPFIPQFGALGRFYEWMQDEPSLQERYARDGMRVPLACRSTRIYLLDNIPYLTRLYAIATDCANDDGPLPAWMKSPEKPSRKSASTEETSLSQGELRVMRWREKQRRKHHAIISDFRRYLKKNPDWASEEVGPAAEIAELFLINTAPMLLLSAEESWYEMRNFLQNTRHSLERSGKSDDYDFYEDSLTALVDMLTDMGMYPPESPVWPLDPFFSEILDSKSVSVESLAPSWPIDQAPDAYEDNLAWLAWNIDRNQRFLFAFELDLEVSGSSGDRNFEHMFNVQILMAVLLRYEKCTMETLPEGLDHLLRQRMDDYDFMTDANVLRKTVGGLRRFYRSMMRLGYLAPETGEELLAYLKKHTRAWADFL